MNVSVKKEFINITFQDDSNTFFYLQNIINKNFSNKIGKKNKIIIFNDANESVQRKYLIKLISKIYKRKKRRVDHKTEKKLQKSVEKSIKLTLTKPNQMQSKINFSITFNKTRGIIFKADSKNNLIMKFITNLFENHKVLYEPSLNSLILKPINLKSSDILMELISKKEIFGWFVDFDCSIGTLENIRIFCEKEEQIIKKTRNMYIFLEEHYDTLECKPEDSFDTIRQKYLQMVKKYHPDRAPEKSHLITSAYTKKFHEIQNAYETIKNFYKNNSFAA